MPEPFLILTVLLIGIVVGILDAIIGGGGLISIPFLIFSGLPPQVAVATDRLGVLGQTIGSIPKYMKEKKIIWRYVLPLTLISIAGGFIGANILLTLSSDMLATSIGFAMIGILPFLFIKKHIGIKHIKTSKERKTIGFAVYFAVMILATFVSAGIGIISLYTILFFFGFTIIEANATGNVESFFFSLFILIIFGLNGIIDYALGITLFGGMMIGGYAGAHIAIKKGDVWVKGLLAVVVIVSGLKLLFF